MEAKQEKERTRTQKVCWRRKVLRWNREMVDAWFRRVAGIAPPKPMRRKSPVKAEATLERFDWSTV